MFLCFENYTPIATIIANLKNYIIKLEVRVNLKDTALLLEYFKKFLDRFEEDLS